MSEWISVDERLPEDPMQTVIVANRKGKVCVAVYSVTEREFGVMCGIRKTFKVTHWMPLPSTEGLSSES